MNKLVTSQKNVAERICVSVWITSAIPFDQQPHFYTAIIRALQQRNLRLAQDLQCERALSAQLSAELETIYDTLDAGARALLAEAAGATEAADATEADEDGYNPYLLTGKELECAVNRAKRGGR